VTVRTSADNWQMDLLSAYASRTSVRVEDDARLGAAAVQAVVGRLGRNHALTQREWIAVAVGLAVGIAGAYLLVMAILDPEPYNTLDFALATGAILIAVGGFATIRVLTGDKPPNIKVNATSGIEIQFN